MLEKLPMYDWTMPYELRKMFKPVGDVIHRSMCPVCGKQRVNLYRYKKEWLCRVCRESAIKVDDALNGVLKEENEG